MCGSGCSVGKPYRITDTSFYITSYMLPAMARSVRSSRSSFDSSNGHETPLHSSLVTSNGDGYDSDSSNLVTP